MQTDNRLFDDLARLAGGALNALTGLKTEIEGLVRQQMETFVGSLHLVTREEFDAVQALAAKARDEQEGLAIRLRELEEELAAIKAELSPSSPKGARKSKTDEVGKTS